MSMLKNKIAVVFAASGDIAGAIARAFAQHGAKVYISALDHEPVKQLAANIHDAGGWAKAAKVNALNEEEIDKYLGRIVAENGRLDIVFNGIWPKLTENGSGKPVTEITYGEFLKAIEVPCGSQFLTSRVAARYMIKTESKGTILTLSAGVSRMKLPLKSGVTAACTAIEGLTRAMAAELGRFGIKVTCLNTGPIAETKIMRETAMATATKLGIPLPDFIARSKEALLLQTGPSLQQVGEVAAFLVSENGVTFNSHIVDADCGRTDVI